ncbi:IP6K3 [Cordylochernes scorpioides]|uniref:Kinase n=1 Tax=Cordylochernes scorpioides TaxID=51811 RepID=A0ABY6L7A4_9ARAC|nr:IP6K3 [Cordylochernes scorpioides]
MVGGRAIILQLDDTTICKPLIPQELDIYTTLPDLLRPFVPKFKDFVDFKWKRGCVRCRIRVNPSSGNMEIQGSSGPATFEDCEEGGSGLHNPWLQYCHRKQPPQSRRFLVLEDLTAGLHRPCVLDLKMGIRQYGDHDTLVKIHRKQARAASTTSCCLGLRMCGMQVFQVDTNKYVCYNKYYGRTLSQEGFRQVLYRFLHNGIQLRNDVITELQEVLQALVRAIRKLDSFRFFCSSLLIVYDGLAQASNGLQGSAAAHVRLIDFAHSTHAGLNTSPTYEGPDEGLIFGLTNLIALLTSIREEGSGLVSTQP